MRRLKFHVLLWIVLISFPSYGQNQLTGKYKNPVIPHNFPDPTVIRADDMYYAAETSSNFAPIYPLYESVDLVNWKQIRYP